MKKVNLKLIVLSILILLLINLILTFFLQPIIIEYLNNNRAFPTINYLVNLVYPRFLVESQRFSVDFFLGKFHQIILRFDIVYCFILATYYVYKSKNSIFEFISNTKPNVPKPKYILILSTIFYSGCIIYTYDWYIILLQLQNFALLYKPVSILNFFQRSYPSNLTIHVICIAYYISLVLVIVQKRKFIPSVIIAICFFYQLGLQQSFEKIDHTYASFGYGILLMPIALYYNGKNQNAVREILFLIQISIGLCYFFSGLEKVLVSGIHWFNGDNFEAHLHLHDTNFKFLLNQKWLIIVLANCAIFLQLFFISSILLKKLRLIFISGGILFHWGTVILLGVGSFYSPWIFMYIFLLNEKTSIFNIKKFL
ncbi:HTTM domain-containing protein [Chondrinema litorale]|uniref:HTTM domain-containing protein n=1 Tax=Chondrinema litorale TaxID=2994555 RepID=UPI0025429619|nr:hypothetical protein [Chondrinema litorale]UZR94611.1 hypothetical protein OQ292_02100 [Chondrinema litorale]